MNEAWRLGWVALGCVGLAGCAVLPAVGLNLAAQGAQGLVALTLGPMVEMQDGAEKDRCTAFADRGIAVTESLETAIPAGEGAVRTFEPAFWRPEFEREGYPQVERSRTPSEGSLAITDRSLHFARPPGTTSVRIPYELVQAVAVRGGSVGGEPPALVVRSCFGRYDIVTFRQRQPDNPETEEITVAAAQLEERVATFRAGAAR